MRALVTLGLGLLGLALIVAGVVAVVALSEGQFEAGADGGEVLILVPPILVIVAAVATGLALAARGQRVGSGPSGLRIVGSVIVGALLAVGVGAGFALFLTAAFEALLGSDTYVNSTGWLVASVFLIFVLPVILGVGCVLLFALTHVSARDVPGGTGLGLPTSTEPDSAEWPGRAPKHGGGVVDAMTPPRLPPR